MEKVTKEPHDLPSRILRVGDCVRVGRNSACEVMIQCPNISSLHCEIEVVTAEEKDDVERSREDLEPLCFVRDHSSNGTWIQRSVKDATSESVVKHRKVVKLSKGSRVCLRPGDLILLLAPMHEACGRYRLALQKGANKGEYVVRQLPWKAKIGVETEMKAIAPSSTTASEVKVSPYLSSASTVGSSASSKLVENKRSDGDSPPGVKRKLKAADCDIDTDSTEEIKRYEVTKAVAPSIATASEVKMSTSVPSISTSNTSKLAEPKTSDHDNPPGAKRKIKAAGNCNSSDIDAGSTEKVKRMKTDEVTTAIAPSCTPALVVKTSPSVSSTSSSSDCKNSDCGSPPGIKRKVEAAGSDADAGSTEKVKRMKTDEVTEMICDKVKERGTKESGHNASDALPSMSSTVPSLDRDVSQECCPICSKLFPVTELAAHSELCQCLLGANPDRVKEEAPVTLPSPSVREADVCTEYCPNCMKLFPLPELIAHSESCTHCTTSITTSTTSDSASIPTAVPSKPAVIRDTSVEQCPNCFKLFPVMALIVHSEECLRSSAAMVSDGREARDSAIETDGGGRRYDLETHSPVREAGSAAVTTARAADGRGVDRRGGRGGSELEQCMYCLQDFAVLELVAHVSVCPVKDTTECTVEEHCQHCLQVFPLDQLVSHALSCPHRKDLGTLASVFEEEGVVGSQDVWGEPVERCMHCFKDFPLSALVEHSRKCTGDMLGSRDRFKGFLPSIHDLGPMALAVLNDTQSAAVEYVIKKSKAASEKVHAGLLKRVCRLGYTEDDMERTLQWVRREAPIIIHVSLDRVLHFLVEDTHYRNQFETRTSGGSTCLSARTSWEDRIFNKIYARSPPVDRVKYGVLNIVGDPCGVRSCYGYGDSFFQLKKVRLRTTFASADTSLGTVKLSCCEYYGNVLHEYSDNELRAILDVSARKKSFLRSDVISNYKEVQIHGPVCLSENVECIVVNDRHAKDPHIGSLLEKFVERNKCNLIWMEPEADMRYPDFSADASRATASFAPVPVPTISSYHPPRRRRRKYGGASSRRRREYYYETYYDDYEDDEYSDSDDYSEEEYYGY